MLTLIDDEAPAPSSITTNGHRVNLLDLPDETIRQIFTTAAGQRRKSTWLRECMLNKRLAKILEPLQFLYVSGPHERSNLRKYYAQLITLKEKLRHSARHAYLALSYPVVDVIAGCAALRHLTGLRTLELDLRRYDVVDDEMLAAMSDLPQLSRLDFNSDFTFSEGTSSPQLRSLNSVSMYACSLQSAFSLYLANLGTVKSLRLQLAHQSGHELGADLPWATLETLEIDLREAVTALTVLNALQQQVLLLPSASCRVRHAVILDPNGIESTLLSSCAFLREMSLETLTAECGRSSELEWPSFGWPTLRTLKLQTCTDLTEPDALADFFRWLSLSPNLETLDLADVQLSAWPKWSHQMDYLFGSQNPEDFDLDMPFLYVLLGRLRRCTGILTFSLRAKLDKGSNALMRQRADVSFRLYREPGGVVPFMRWKRDSRDEDFKQEVWWEVQG